MGKAYAKKKVEHAGSGALVQLIGLIMLFVLPFAAGVVGWIIGFIAFISMLVIGSFMATKWICSACNNRIDNEQVKVCPTCRAELG